MSRQVLIENNDNKVIAPATEVNKVVVLDNCEPNSVKVYDNANNVIKVITQGPQGPVGIPSDISGYLTTASFNAITSSMSVLYAESSSHSDFAHTSSFATNAQIASYANFSGFAISSSFALSARSSSYAVTSSLAQSGKGSFSGSFSGSGDNLFNIPASAIIGLNLSQISSGSYSASISNEGLLVNSKIIAESFTGSLEGTASIAISSSYALTASYAANVPLTASYALNSDSSSYSYTASSAISSSFALTASYAANVPLTASYALNAESSSYSYTASSAISAYTANSSISSSYSQTSSYAPNYLSLQGGQISGSLTLLGDLTVYGSSSFVYITASQLSVSASTISVNVFEPVERFGGLIVYDSGSISHQATASLLWDSLNNHWVYQNATGSGGTTYSGGGLMSGPRNTGSLGQETYPTRNRVLRGQGGDHLYDSNIFDDDSKIALRISSDITGSLYVSNGITGSLFGTSSVAINIDGGYY